MSIHGKGGAQARGPATCAALEYAAARERHILLATLYAVPLQGAALHKVWPHTCAAPCWQQAARAAHIVGPRACATPPSRGVIL